MTLAAVVVEPLRPSQPAIDLDDAAPAEALADLVDRLANRLGGNAVVRLAPFPSHLPERACREIPALAGQAADLRPSRPSPRPTSDGEDHRSRQPRPLHLLASPQPIEVIAPVPDGPPALFRWRRRQHRIVAAEGPERIGPEWWLTAGGHSPEEQSRVRDYWRVENADGGRFWIYREGFFRPDRPPRWYLHGLFG